MVQFATISHSQIYPGEFLKFTGMPSILESNLLKCIFSVSRWPPRAVVRLYTKQTSISVWGGIFKSVLENYYVI